MQKGTIVILLGLVALMPWVIGIIMWQSEGREVESLPTRVVLPSPMATHTATHTPTHMLHTPTVTPSHTATATLMSTDAPTHTPTLSVRVLNMEAIMPGVVIAPAPTDFPFGTILLSAPPHPIEPLPDATHEPPPYVGWYSFESDHPTVQYSGRWTPQLNRDASRGQYHRTERVGDSLRFVFEGEAFRVRYVSAVNMGRFEIWLDGVRLDVIDAESPDVRFPGTQVYLVGSGLHLLEIRNASGISGIDAIQVFRGSANTVILPLPIDPPPSPLPPIPALSVQQVAAPPVIPPTHTPSAPQERIVSVVIAYDENGNRAVDPAEGVVGIPVRVVEAGTNRQIAQTLTDEQGYAQLRVTTPDTVRVVVPYFGRVWEVSARASGEARFTWLLEPGTQPGLIP